MRLMLISDCRRACPTTRTDAELVSQARAWLAEAVDAGVDIIQLREPSLPASHLATLTAGLVNDAAGTATRIVVNDRADVAVAADAHGVHLKDDGWPLDRVRDLVGQAVIGRSIHATEDVHLYAGADYLVFGAVFGSGAKPAVGVKALADVVQASAAPVFAVGGVTPETASACRRAGAAGLAAITMFLPAGIVTGALGPQAAVARLRYS